MRVANRMSCQSPEQLDRALHWKTKFQKLKWFHKTTKKKLHDEIQEQGLILGFLNYNNKF